MKKWVYYIKGDPEKKPIREVYATNIHEATTIASRMEKIKAVAFLEFFTIKLKNYEK